MHEPPPEGFRALARAGGVVPVADTLGRAFRRRQAPVAIPAPIDVATPAAPAAILAPARMAAIPLLGPHGRRGVAAERPVILAPIVAVPIVGAGLEGAGVVERIVAASVPSPRAPTLRLRRRLDPSLGRRRPIGAPIGHRADTLFHGVGGHRPTDVPRMGVPMDVVGLASVLAIGAFFPPG